MLLEVDRKVQEDFVSLRNLFACKTFGFGSQGSLEQLMHPPRGVRGFRTRATGKVKRVCTLGGCDGFPRGGLFCSLCLNVRDNFVEQQIQEFVSVLMHGGPKHLMLTPKNL